MFSRIAIQPRADTIFVVLRGIHRIITASPVDCYVLLYRNRRVAKFRHRFIAARALYLDGYRTAIAAIFFHVNAAARFRLTFLTRCAQCSMRARMLFQHRPPVSIGARYAS